MPRLLETSFQTAKLSTVLGVLCLLGGLVPANSAKAEIMVKTLDDGTQLIYNESPVQRARRRSERLLPPPNEELESLIRRHAFEHGLSPTLVQAVMQVESGYNPRALSQKGAMGLMQLMPDTARLLGVKDPWDPAENIRAGSRYLREQLDRFGNLNMALAAYNAGPGAVSRFAGIPPYAETQRYVEKILALYQHQPPALVQDHARQQAREREIADKEKRSKDQASTGSQVFVTRDENNRIVFTTVPPGSR